MHALRNTVVCLALAAIAPGARAQALSLDEALKLGAMQSPRLAAQRSMVSSASEQVGRAAELPDPRLKLGLENLPISGADRFRYDRDFMTARTVGLMQEFPSADKRAARGARATRALEVEGGMLSAQGAILDRDIAVAWFDVHFSERTRAALDSLLRQLETQAEASAPGVARGQLSAAEGLMARTAAEQARDRILEQERAVSRARIVLASLLGDAAQRPVGAAPDTAKLIHPREMLLANLHSHPHVRVYDRREELARAEVDLARASRKSDWSLEVGYGHRRPAFDNMLTVMVAIDLPWQAERRQDRDIASRLAELEQARALREDARRTHEAELRGWLADYDAASRRLERYRDVLAPLARQRAEAALAAYRGGRAELAPALDALRAVTETELAAITVEAERARAWANLTYLYPHEASHDAQRH